MKKDKHGSASDSLDAKDTMAGKTKKIDSGRDAHLKRGDLSRDEVLAIFETLAELAPDLNEILLDQLERFARKNMAKPLAPTL